MEERSGLAKILKVFSNQQGRIVLGGRVEEGVMVEGKKIKLMHGETEIARGEIVSLQTQKTSAKQIENGKEFGAMIKAVAEPVPGDYIEMFDEVYK